MSEATVVLRCAYRPAALAPLAQSLRLMVVPPCNS
jgi:hypothetical protein